MQAAWFPLKVGARLSESRSHGSEIRATIRVERSRLGEPCDDSGVCQKPPVVAQKATSITSQTTSRKCQYWAAKSTAK